MEHPIQIAKTTLCGLLLGAVSFSAQANSYEDGLMAYAVGNYAKAGQHLMTAADNGNTGAEHMLMRLFSEGKLLAVNTDQETFKWTRKAAENGLMQAQYALAEIYANKQGNAKEAVKWYRKAADQSHPDAFFKLGEILKDGAKGVAANSSESNRMYQIAASEFDVYAQKGNPQYQYTLATMYQQAKGVKKDMNMTLKWMEKSALHGHALAQLTLGRLYTQGDDIPRDTYQARYWLSMAAAQGLGEATVMLNELNRNKNAELALAM